MTIDDYAVLVMKSIGFFKYGLTIDVKRYYKENSKTYKELGEELYYLDFLNLRDISKEDKEFMLKYFREYSCVADNHIALATLKGKQLQNYIDKLKIDNL